MDAAKVLDVKNFIVEVEFDGLIPGAPPLRIPVQQQTPYDALRMVKHALLESETRGAVPAGGSAFTIAVFPEYYEAGTESLVAERITLVTMPFADEIECDEA
ncbi:hypothetical protein ACIQVO_38670 [Streptomyces sp. NPDC101062]|uniref:hypothetical protein n=1 Tax=unclassified Streptomyces TaxID=2593676 RepID=UPI003829EF35